MTATLPETGRTSSWEDHRPTSTVAAAIDAGSEAAAEPFARPATTESWDPVREPVRGGVAYPPLAALPGLEQVRAFLAGRASAPSVSRLTGRRIVDASVGSATYALPATDWMVGPKGAVHSGALAVLADGALIASVISALPARVLCTTAELSMTFLGSPPSPGGDLTARGRLLHLDAEMALAEVHVHDARDRLVAHGTSRCAVFPPIDESIPLLPPGGSAVAETEPTTPDPHVLLPRAAGSGRLREARDGLELLRAQLRGELPRP
ncbi:MAG TPA: PaaI family thioesterase, partial [Gaiellaceae bacterium]|nr:PaaI family thioesterase [Gaiellaceae bacterium]